VLFDRWKRTLLPTFGTAYDLVVTVSRARADMVTRRKGRRVRHLDQHGLPAIPAGPGLSRAVANRTVLTPWPRQSGAAAAPRLNNVLLHAARRPDIRRQWCDDAFAARSCG